VDATALSVRREDFLEARSSITPAAYRAAATHARPLASLVQPLLRRPLTEMLVAARLALPMVPVGTLTTDGKSCRQSVCWIVEALSRIYG
jgi:hypothetical protein